MNSTGFTSSKGTLMNAACCIAALLFSTVAVAQPSYNVLTLTRAPLAGAQQASFQGRVTDTMYLTGSQGVLTSTPFGSQYYAAHAVLWARDAATTELPLPPAITPAWNIEWRGQDVNTAGDVLVTVSDPAGATLALRNRTFVRALATGTYTEYTVTNLPQFNRWFGAYLLDTGAVVGTASDANTGQSSLIRWTSTTTASVLPLPSNPAPHATNPAAQFRDVAPNGWMLVQYNNTAGFPVQCVLNPEGVLDHFINAPADATGAYQFGAARINRAGESCGVKFNTPPQHPMIWNAAGTPIDLDPLAADWNYANQLNDARWMTGATNTGTTFKLFIPGTGTFTFAGLVNAGQLPAGINATSIGAINNNGQILGLASDGVPRLYTPSNDCPIVTQHPPASFSLCNTNTMTLSAAGYAAQPITYQWRRDSQVIPGAIGPTYTFTNLTNADAGMYDCVLIDTCGNAVTTPCAVSIVTHRCGLADIGGQGGLHAPCGDGILDNNDFVVFVNFFFQGNPIADFGRQGGLDGADGQFDNNDFVVFVNQFFTGC